MSNFSWLRPAARARKTLVEWIDQSSCLPDQLNRLIQARNYSGKFALLGLAAAVAAFLCCTAISGQKPEESAAMVADSGTPAAIDSAGATNDHAVYVHNKLMPVTVAGSGVPVLRFVECRHYAKEHMKLVQVGMTSAGRPVLRLTAGDVCVFDANPSLSAEAARYEPGAEGLLAGNDPQSKFALLNVSPERFGRLSPYQRYACEKFGPSCRTALAIQLAENPTGACEIYHYNSSDGTLDWGFFQINTVHLTRRGLNLRDLLDCKANIDFAYKLFREEGFEPWTTYVSGAYRRFLYRDGTEQGFPLAVVRRSLAGQFFRSGIDSF